MGFLRMTDPRKWAGELSRHILYIPHVWWSWAARRAERDETMSSMLGKVAWHYGYGAQIMAIHEDGRTFVISEQDEEAAHETGGGEQIAQELQDFQQARKEHERARRDRARARDRDRKQP